MAPPKKNRALVGDETLAIEGLNDFRREVRKLGSKDLNREVGQAHKQVGQLIVREAKKQARHPRGTNAAQARVIQSAAESLRAAANRTAVQVAVGNARTPYGWGAEFGSRTYSQFGPWRGNQFDVGDGAALGVEGVGYMIHPAMRDNRDEIAERYLAEMDRVARLAFPD